MTALNGAAHHPIGLKKRLSCVTCSQALPLDDKGNTIEPDYFGAVSTGYTANSEGDRGAEDIGRLLAHMNTVNDSIRDKFRLLEDDGDEATAYLGEARSLHALLRDLHLQVGVYLERLDHWLLHQIQERKED